MMMIANALTISHEQDEALQQEIHAHLRTHNRIAHRQFYFEGNGDEIRREPLTLTLRDFDGELLAGLSASSVWGAMFIDDLWVATELQGQGIGTDLMRRAEAEAHERGCAFIWLQTFSFQARGFYENLGYRVVGTLENYPPGQALYTLRKDLKD